MSRSAHRSASGPAVPALAVSVRVGLASAAMALALSACAQTAPPPPPAPSSDSFSAGISFDAKAVDKDLQVPVYPGATPMIEHKDDKSGVTMSLWGGLFGMSVSAGKFQSRDDVDSVGRYYRKALTRYGTLLDCGDPQVARGKPKDGGPMTCDDDKPEPGGQLYKVGQAKNFRVVAIKPLQDGTTQIAIARVQFR
ncbi:hypothetical protein [Roseateles sp.]|uniref:hypothetical protein n=1 Tax=Roseateles sp. TaxID=1971397 RepID=UPI0031DEEDA1